MTATAMIMAGGGGARMLASGVRVPKALVPVAGVPLLERNFLQLARHGMRRVAVAVPGGASAVADFAAARLGALAAQHGIALDIHREESPLGNIGAVRAAPRAGDGLLVVYADNLTSLDLRRICDFHRERGADLTLAVHRHPFRMPFGEVRLEGEAVTDYVEKPTYRIAICSAVSVLSENAIAAIGEGEPLGISDLARRLIAARRRVLAFEHDAPWIDVNARDDIDAAERLLRDHAAAFGDPAAPS